MNETLIREGGRYAAEGAMRSPPVWWRAELFGFIPMPIVWNVFIIVLVALIFWWLLRGSRQARETPLEILQKRYVTCDIDRETFLQMKKDLSE